VILKDKKYSLKYVKKTLEIFSKAIYALGLLVFSLILITLIYYNNSGMRESFPPTKLFQKIDNIIINKYLGFSIFEIDDYVFIKFKTLKYLLVNNELENVEILIDQENLYKLEFERKKKLKDKFYNFNKFADATIDYNNDKFNVKLRLKGDRSIHWSNKKNSSYKVDIKGDKRLWGLEEFSVQKPIARNYIYEFIFHKLLEKNNLISLKYFFINLKINDLSSGIYAVEEGFSKELIERNKRRNGPIFGLNESEGVVYPKVIYDLYSKNYWIENNPKLIEAAFSKLNLLKDNKIEIDEIFDLKEWAKFFAIIDYSNALHGSLSKSVKLYYNPATGKFEPIGFDGHYYELNPANNFIILDFLNPLNNNCNHICYDREWYGKFLKDKNGNPNKKFIKLYIDQLNKIASDEFLINFKQKNLKEIQYFNEQLSSEISVKDRALYKGLGYFIFDDKFLDKRHNFIKNKLNKILYENNIKAHLESGKIKFISNKNDTIKKLNKVCSNGINTDEYVFNNFYLNFNKNCRLFFNKNEISVSKKINLSNNYQVKKSLDITNLPEIDVSEELYYLDHDLIITQDLYLPENKKLIISEGVKISMTNNSIFESLGSIKFDGSLENPIILNGNKSGSMILKNNKYTINNTIIYNFNNPQIEDKILHGGINIISSELEILNLKIKNSQSEDAINIVSSNTKIENLDIENSFSDAIDIDFGNVSFSKITCSNTKNDCFDVSGVNVSGEQIISKNSNDKAISFGENSSGHINLVNLEDNFLGIAVKDGSILKIDTGIFNGNNYDASIFKKKNEFGNSLLKINNKELNNLNVLVGKNNDFIIGEQHYIYEKLDNKYIYNLFY
jgi:hypothetical protein